MEIKDKIIRKLKDKPIGKIEDEFRQKLENDGKDYGDLNASWGVDEDGKVYIDGEDILHDCECYIEMLKDRAKEYNKENE